jgi:hypothetical protein
LSTIEASEPYKSGIIFGSADKAVDGQYINKDFPSIYHSKGNSGKFKIIFREPQTYIDIVYYNRHILNERMNGGILELFNKKNQTLLKFTMTKELVQFFSHERIKHFITKKTDWTIEEINELQPIVKKRITEHITSEY